MDNIELETERFLEILFNCYKETKNDELEISSRILNDCGFNISESGKLFNIICPRLKREGFLRKFSSVKAAATNSLSHIYEHQSNNDPSKRKPLWIFDGDFNFVFTVNPEKLEGLDRSKLSNTSKSLTSLHLLTHSLEPIDVIFLVLDEHYKIPIRCSIKSNQGGSTYIKKLYDIAYIVDAPGKKVDYDKKLADMINNGIFRKRMVAKYMKTNGLSKPTLVQKSPNNTLVLKNEFPVKIGLIKHCVPLQDQPLYVDKTK